MTHVAKEPKLRHQCTHAKENRWQLGVRPCIMPELPTHLVQELNVCIVDCSQVFLFPTYTSTTV